MSTAQIKAVFEQAIHQWNSGNLAAYLVLSAGIKRTCWAGCNNWAPFQLHDKQYEQLS